MPEPAAGAAPAAMVRPGLPGLFLAFLRLGVTAFGGPAMIAHIKDLSVRRHHWVDERTFDDGLVLSQSLPGATAMQVAAYVGLRARGPAGALAAFLGLGLPAFFLMLALSASYARAHAVPSILALLNGLQVIVVALIAHAAWTFGRPSLRSAGGLAVFAASAAGYFLKASPFLVILGSAVAGLALFRDRQPAAGAPGPAPARRSARPWLLFALALAAGLAGVHRIDPRLFTLSEMMLRVNAFAFGGGFSSLPLLLHEVVDVRHWMDARTFMDGIALGQVTPGPISITATFIGYLLSGPFGAAVATVAMFTPSFALLLAAAPYFDRIRSSALYARASRGIAAGFVALLLVVAVRFAAGVAWGPVTVALGLGALAALFRKVDVLYVVLVGSVLSVALR